MNTEQHYSSLRHGYALWLIVAFLLLYALTRWYHLTLLPMGRIRD